jgi:hypothetical protein
LSHACIFNNSLYIYIYIYIKKKMISKKLRKIRKRTKKKVRTHTNQNTTIVQESRHSSSTPPKLLLTLLFFRGKSTLRRLIQKTYKFFNENFQRYSAWIPKTNYTGYNYITHNLLLLMMTIQTLYLFPSS